MILMLVLLIIILGMVAFAVDVGLMVLLRAEIQNAVDAGARQIDVVVRDGGRTFISIDDDGCGMSADELSLAIERHATSKLPDDDLLRIDTLGFRGEALPSIGAVSRLSLTSRREDGDTAWSVSVEGGRKEDARPAARSKGTRVEAVLPLAEKG